MFSHVGLRCGKADGVGLVPVCWVGVGWGGFWQIRRGVVCLVQVRVWKGVADMERSGLSCYAKVRSVLVRQMRQGTFSQEMVRSGKERQEWKTS